MVVTVVNLLPVVSGGGMQNALSFLDTLPPGHEPIVVLCRKGSPIAQKCRDVGVDVREIRFRSLFEIVGGRYLFCKGTTCFTLFGPPPFGTKGRWINVVGVAYSNLFYPEIDFWCHLPFLKKVAKRIKDHTRSWLIRRGDAWVFETFTLRKRAVEQGFPSDRTFCVPMAVSNVVVTSRGVDPDFKSRTRRTRILYLAGAHPNKRQHLLPEIAAQLSGLMGDSFEFVTTMHPEDPYARTVLEAASQLGVFGSISNIGPVSPENVARTIDGCDALILLSRLESFSNNFVEAWARGKPLFVTDADWARDSCEDGAVYVDPEDPCNVAAELSRVLCNRDSVRGIVDAGRKVLSTYPTAHEKTKMYFSLIEQARATGHR